VVELAVKNVGKKFEANPDWKMITCSRATVTFDGEKGTMSEKCRKACGCPKPPPPPPTRHAEVTPVRLTPEPRGLAPVSESKLVSNVQVASDVQDAGEANPTNPTPPIKVTADHENPIAVEAAPAIQPRRIDGGPFARSKRHYDSKAENDYQGMSAHHDQFRGADTLKRASLVEVEEDGENDSGEEDASEQEANEEDASEQEANEEDANKGQAASSEEESDDIESSREQVSEEESGEEESGEEESGEDTSDGENAGGEDASSLVEDDREESAEENTAGENASDEELEVSDTNLPSNEEPQALWRR